MANGTSNPKEYVTHRREFGDEEFDVLYYRSTPLDAPLETKLPGTGVYPSLAPHTYVDNGVRCDQDTAVELRDGVTIYVDVFRPDGPTGEQDLPAILSWSYYGKTSYGFLDPGRARRGRYDRRWMIIDNRAEDRV